MREGGRGGMDGMMRESEAESKNTNERDGRILLRAFQFISEAALERDGAGV